MEVTAALGHSDSHTTSRYYAHVFTEARMAGMPRTMVEAIYKARAQGEEKLRGGCADTKVRHLRLVATA